MDLLRAAVVERIRSSLFVVPVAFLLGGIVLGFASIELDRRVVDTNTDLPVVLTSTVDSARAVLGTVASATITVAGIAFSISLLVIQLASSQYSPRVVHGLLRDPLSKRVMGVVVATFAYCLVVLRAVRGPLEEDGDPTIPNVSVAIAVVLGIVSILLIIAFIDHSAHTMDVSRILSSATDAALDGARRMWAPSPSERQQDVPVVAVADPPDDHLLVELSSHGWVQQVDLDAVSLAAPPGGTVRLEIEVGRYAVAGTPLCRVWPMPDDPDAACEQARKAIYTGPSRSVEHDVGYGIRQLADVALRALSPSVNDPTTAQDAMFHAGSVLRELMERVPPPEASVREDDRTLVRPERVDHVDLVDLAFDEVRIAAAGMPTMCIYLLELLALLDESAGEGRPEVRAAMARQASMIRASAGRADLDPRDADRIRDAHDRRFGTVV
jgi:uncharacterized membrane protein